MKNIIRITTVLIIIFYSIHANAACKHIDELMKNLGSQPGYALVPIGKDNLKKSLGNLAVKDYENVENLLVLTTEEDSKNEELRAQVETVILADKLIEVTNIKDGGEGVKIYKDRNGKKFSNLILLINDGGDCVLVCVKGSLDESSIGGFLKNMSFD